jgi:carbon monoxide dehydrogenase subunit G
MLIEGKFAVAAPRERVWQAIVDPALMVACIPGCETIETIDDTHYRTTILVEVGPIKARFNLVVEVTGQSPPDSIASVTRGEEGTRASILNAESRVSLAALDGGQTEVAYRSEVSVTGRLGRFGLGIMKKKAENLGAQFAERFRQKIETASSAA